MDINDLSDLVAFVNEVTEAHGSTYDDDDLEECDSSWSEEDDQDVSISQYLMGDDTEVTSEAQVDNSDSDTSTDEDDDHLCNGVEPSDQSEGSELTEDLSISLDELNLEEPSQSTEVAAISHEVVDDNAQEVVDDGPEQGEAVQAEVVDDDAQGEETSRPAEIGSSQ